VFVLDVKFLQSWYNQLDFFILASAFPVLLHIGDSSVVSMEDALRVFRALRPLSAIKHVKLLHPLYNTLHDSRIHMYSVTILFAAMVVGFAALGIESFYGDFEHRCVSPHGLLTQPLKWCSAVQGTCSGDSGHSCSLTEENPRHGYAHFNNAGSATIGMLQILGGDDLQLYWASISGSIVT